MMVPVTVKGTVTVYLMSCPGGGGARFLSVKGPVAKLSELPSSATPG